ncbi:hypothetical protein LOC71_20075 [Rhodopirellula sp. JC740]|uniref:Uncharacterized protein n=1 Tax=Rhodopirellula halodulae TaxID=2894198 RepID=A0ABS8NP67_9BACT|nr:hypothetical protein [Rhodopirellula sp. JC740]MCC9644578.1 hypothetical protein [Rhodopirellula sp. JC740]
MQDWNDNYTMLTVLMNVTRMEDLAPQYQRVAEESSMPWVWIVVGAIVTLSIIGGLIWNVRFREPEVPTSDALTMELCRAHQLPIYHRGLMDRLATAAKLGHTAELFLSPTHFDAAVERGKTNMRLRRHHQIWLGQIRRSIFCAD